MAVNKTSPVSLLSTSSEESKTVKYSYASQVGSLHTKPLPDSDEDFCMLTVEEPATEEQGNRTIPMNVRRTPSVSQERMISPSVSVVVNGCPCSLNDNCEKSCCVNSLRAVHRARVEKLTDQSKLLTNANHNRQSSGSSYGSLDNVQPMRSPVSHRSINVEYEEEEEDDRESSDEALLNSAQRSIICSGSTSPPLLVVQGNSLPEQSIRCGCHVKVVDHTTRKAVIKLLVASLIALLFMIGEVLGGYFANSLAIMTDAAHMLSDFAGFLISLFAIWVSKRPPSRGMSFGWYRAEVIGALVSVLIIWVITGILFYEAVMRVVHMDFEVNADIMLITACVGVFVNVFMCSVLGHGHGHSHGGHGGHGHSHGGHGKKEPQTWEERRKKKRSVENINVRAAFIHVIGDLIQSIGVVMAGYIIWIWPQAKIADPICTFVFCILVLISTFNILKDALRVVMEGTPKHLDYEVVKANLNGVEGVKQAHSLHIWSLTLNRTALSAHLVLEPGANGDKVLAQASHLLQENHHINQTTLQVESYQAVMAECGQCQEAERTGVLYGLIPNFLRRKSDPEIVRA